MNEGLQEVLAGLVAHQRASLVGVGTRLARAAIGVLILFLMFLAIWAYGYYVGWKHRGNAEAAQQLVIEENRNAEMQRLIVRNAAISAQYEEEKAKQKTIYRTIRQEVPHVVTHYVERPGAPAVPVPDWVVTRGFVRLWNASLDGGVPGAAAGLAGPAAAADPADDQRAGLDAVDILTNHVDNAEQYRECRAQLQTLIDWHRQRR